VPTFLNSGQGALIAKHRIDAGSKWFTRLTLKTSVPNVFFVRFGVGVGAYSQGITLHADASTQHLY